MEDETIIELYWQRDEAAIAETAGKYGAFCHRIAFNILRVTSDAEECVNDTWHAAWQAMPPQRPGSLRAFLGRITRNLSLDRWRAAHTAKRGDGMDLLLSELDEATPSPGTVEEQIEHNRLSALISDWLESLPTDDCALFVRRYWYGDAVQDLARAAGRSPNTVTKQLGRLRQKLRVYLEREGVEL
ncbi:MAG: sigma-70 family RNA polymerase sigma factor [Clostridia bacterium]|nr:sigma-70 family RNA polymerase sigma factor [Clostridia bacterium]